MTFLATLFGLLTSKGGAIVGFALAILLGVFLVSAKLDVARLNKSVRDLNDKLAASDQNLKTCKTNLDGANGSLAALSTATQAKADEDAASLAKAAAALVAAQKSASKADARIALLSKPLVGADLCTRAVEAQKRVVESVK